MRIGMRCRPLSRQRTGIGNYIKGLVDLLPQIAPEHSYSSIRIEASIYPSLKLHFNTA